MSILSSWPPSSYDSMTSLQKQLMDAYKRIAELEKGTRGLTDGKFNDTSSADLILELIARGFAVYKPVGEESASET
jgi:hypothetical protein